MDISSLKSFYTVARCLHFTKASNLLFMSQPTLSRQISILESEVGFKLFNRNNKSVSLTTAGNNFLQKVIPVLDSYEELIKSVNMMKDGSIGRLRIGYFENLGFPILAEATTRLKKDYPLVDLEVIPDELPSLMKLLIDDQIDVLITIKIDIDINSYLVWRELCSNVLQCIVPENHPFAGRETVSIEDLKTEKIIMPPREDCPPVIDWLLKVFKAKKIMPNIVGYGKGSRNMMLQAVADRGVCIMSSQLKANALPGLAFIDIIESEDLFNIGLAWKSTNDNPMIRKFAVIAKECGRVNEKAAKAGHK